MGIIIVAKGILSSSEFCSSGIWVECEVFMVTGSSDPLAKVDIEVFVETDTPGLFAQMDVEVCAVTGSSEQGRKLALNIRI